MAEADSPSPPAGDQPGLPRFQSAVLPGSPSLELADYSAALVATVPRWLAVSAALEVGLAAGLEGLLLFTHRPGSAALFLWPLALGATAGSLLIYAMLRAEESRLARELRTARIGTPVIRGMVARRRQQMPFLTRWSSSRLGTAAVLLADGDRDGALDALRASSVFMRGGRLDQLRAIVEADLERNTGTSVGLERCVQRLRAATSVGNREADRYRVHVLAKAVLEQGDDDTAVELAAEWHRSSDDDVRVYATWLRVWFDLDDETGEGAPPSELSEADVRMAMLAARAHGAESLVTKLTERLSAIARTEAQG
jgi:hypothetical protein